MNTNNENKIILYYNTKKQYLPLIIMLIDEKGLKYKCINNKL